MLMCPKGVEEGYTEIIDGRFVTCEDAPDWAVKEAKQLNKMFDEAEKNGMIICY